MAADYYMEVHIPLCVLDEDLLQESEFPAMVDSEITKLSKHTLVPSEDGIVLIYRNPLDHTAL